MISVIVMERRAEDAVRYRDTGEGRRQSDALRAAAEQSGRKRSAIVADLDREIAVGHDQYRRYLRGDTPLRLDQLSAFARALNTTKAALSRALGLMDDDPLVAALRELDVAPETLAEAAAASDRLPPDVREIVTRQARALSLPQQD